MNINSISNKFDQLKNLVVENLDILIITETKLDSTFPTSQFLINGFCKPFRRDRNRDGGGVLIYVREDIPSKQVKISLASDIESIFVELNFRKTKWLLFGCYHPPSQNDEYFFGQLSNYLDQLSHSYEKYMLIGDFNAEDSEPCLGNFLFEHNAKNIVKDHTCFKSVENPSCIDLVITNSTSSFQNTTVVSTGLSDFHKMVVTVLKTSFIKIAPKTQYFRDYKHFDSNDFKNELQRKLIENDKNDYISFEKNFLSVLNKHAPLKKKKLRANEVPYMTKTLRKAIMKRTELETKYLKNKSKTNLSSYKKQRNFCSKLYKKERKKYYNNLNIKNITENKEFWRTIKPFLSEKTKSSQKIFICKGDEIISDDRDIAENFSQFFQNAVNSLGIENNQTIIEGENPVDTAIKTFENHPSIKLIKTNITVQKEFNFQSINTEFISNEIADLDSNKNGTFKNVPTRKLKEFSDICSPSLEKIWNDEILNKKHFSHLLKLADVTPVYKKNDKLLVDNYRPVSVLPTVSKIFEKIMQKQFNEYIEKYLSPFLCGYRKGFSTQTALVSLIEKWKSCLDNNGYAGAVLMDLSKAFDTINHQLLIAKLHAYGFSTDALELILSYLSNRWQRVKINTSFSSWTELIQGVPQGSVLGPILFNIYINDLFFLLTEINVCNFADDTTPFVCDNDLGTVLNKLEQNSALAISWFESNYMKLNTDKCHLLVSGSKYEHTWVQLGEDKIWENDTVKLLGVTIDNELKFDNHVLNICSKANQKLTALLRMKNFLSLEKRRTLFKAFIESQFKYCPLIWMFHGRKINEKINRLHERSLRIVYNDYTATFEELLAKDGSFSIHHQNIQTLLVEIYKSLNDIPGAIFKHLFSKTQHDYSLRTQQDFTIPRINTVLKGQNSLRYFGAVIWNSLPVKYKNIESLSEFKSQIKKWKPKTCPCRLCKNFVKNLGFANIVET